MKDQPQSKCGHSVHRRTVHPRNLQDAASSDVPECGRWSNARHIPSVQFTCEGHLDLYVRKHGPLLSTLCWNSGCIRGCERGSTNGNSAFKELDPILHFKATAKLGGFLEARFSSRSGVWGGIGRPLLGDRDQRSLQQTTRSRLHRFR